MMAKQLVKFIKMITLGAKYIKIFRTYYDHPYISFRQKYKALSKERQNYSNTVLEILNINVQLHGTIPSHDRVLYAINHRSLLDIIVMEHLFSKTQKMGTWIAKQELFDAFYGEFFLKSGCVSVDLESKRGLVSFFKTIKTLLTKIEDFNIYIFPEGERNKTDKILPFQGGAAKIAKANNLTIIPVFIDDKLEKVFQEAPFNAPYTVHVYVGEAIKKPQELEERYQQFIEEIQQ